MAACPKCGAKAKKNAQRLFVCSRHGILPNLIRRSLDAQARPS